MQLFQGEKPAHDFLSLHTGGGSSSPVQHSAQGYDLGVHASLKPLKLGKRRGGGAVGMAPSGLETDSEEHLLPGGVGTFSIRQAPSTAQPRGQPAGQGVGARGAFAPVLHGSRTTEATHGAESGARAHSGPASMWQDSGTDQRSRGESLFVMEC
ncbi:transcription factor BIM2-like isoform X1 [Panicum miliaceum]|uniref:Transcription factor BIM2-like isoform X1 n=1 Tax=Panicum miliaceum TaxID=4540 RepID=A0A3L6RUI6_PANMI|nr:transcription factor BIM2-like isoform X1 [Panicum miliaceum]